MLKDKTVLLGVTGSIAAYKIAYLASALKKLHADVHVLMTKNGQHAGEKGLPCPCTDDRECD
jgi:phosphopantothenoylcysteine synthetase/decarboxylase